MATVTITFKDQESDGTVNVTIEPAIPSENRTEAEQLAADVYEDICNGESFMEMLEKQGS